MLAGAKEDCKKCDVYLIRVEINLRARNRREGLRTIRSVTPNQFIVVRLRTKIGRIQVAQRRGAESISGDA